MRTARAGTATAAWFTVVVFARLYTVALCDFPEHALGSRALCYTWINDIPIYLWIEIILYGPVVWFALHRINTDAFADAPLSASARVTHQRRKHVGTAAAAVVLYGVGIHVTDVFEVLAQERELATDDVFHEVADFLDEGLSHYVQFVTLFFLLGWWVIFDRGGRTDHPRLALFLGVAMGVERALGTIEGEKWFLGPLVIVWMATAVWLRHRRLGAAVRGEFFVRHAVAFLVTLPAALLLYGLWFDAFTPPSRLPDSDYAQVVVGAVALTVVGTALALAVDRRWGHRPRRR